MTKLFCAVLIVAVILSATLPALAAAPLKSKADVAQFLAQLKQKQKPKAKPKPAPKPAAKPIPQSSVATTGNISYSGGTTVSAGTLTESLGSASSAANQFTNAYDGANMTFLGAVTLFQNVTLDNRITVNNTTTFAGGWSASSITTASPSVVINGSPTGKLVIAGTIDLEKPMAIQTVTVDLNGSMSYPANTVIVSAGGTISNGIDSDLPIAGSVYVGSTLNGSVTFNPNGNGLIINPATLSISAKLAGSTGIVNNFEDWNSGTIYDAWPAQPTDFTGAGNDNVLIKYTYFGDVDLNGGVSPNNLSAWQSAFGGESDPNISFDPMARFATPVPEPSAIILGSWGATALWLIRRRRAVRSLSCDDRR